MPSIAGIATVGWQGRILPARLDHRLVSRPAVRGQGVLWDEWRAPVSRIETHHEEDADPASREQQLRELIRTKVTVEDDLGRITEGVVVLDCEVTIWRRLPEGWLLRAVWSLLGPSDPPVNEVLE